MANAIDSLLALRLAQETGQIPQTLEQGPTLASTQRDLTPMSLQGVLSGLQTPGGTPSLANNNGMISGRFGGPPQTQQPTGLAGLAGINPEELGAKVQTIQVPRNRNTPQVGGSFENQGFGRKDKDGELGNIFGAGGASLTGPLGAGAFGISELVQGDLDPAEGAITGAAIGMNFGGPVGAAIGAAIGLGASFLDKGKDRRNEQRKAIANRLQGIFGDNPIRGNNGQILEIKPQGPGLELQGDLAAEAISMANIAALGLAGGNKEFREDLGAMLASAALQGATNEGDLRENMLALIRGLGLKQADARAGIKKGLESGQFDDNAAEVLAFQLNNLLGGGEEGLARERRFFMGDNFEEQIAQRQKAQEAIDAASPEQIENAIRGISF